jgi:N-acetylglucosamine-6-phosphate deacetylase
MAPFTMSGRLVDGTAARITVDQGRIAAVEPLSPGNVADPTVDECPWVLPGLIDLQVNGFAGLDVNDDGLTTGVVHALVRAQWQRGVTTFLPTVITASAEKTRTALETIALARAEDSLTRYSIPGIHLEGPYLSYEDGPRGAHDATHIRPPDLREFDQWRQASADAVRLITLAPESPGAADYIRAVVGHGTAVAIGHTAATPDQVHAAVDAGATLSTHLGNGCHSVLPRHPNHIWAQLADSRLSASFVADGHHLPADTFIAMVRAKGVSNAVLVSDSVALAGCAPGSYATPVGGAVTLHPQGRLTLAGSDLLAGSVASLVDCLAWGVNHAALDLSAAVTMASANPARLIGLDSRGRIEPGAAADLTFISPDLTAVPATVVRGVVVHRVGS